MRERLKYIVKKEWKRVVKMFIALITLKNPNNSNNLTSPNNANSANSSKDHRIYHFLITK